MLDVANADRRVIVLSDSPDLRRLYQAVLEGDGFAVAATPFPADLDRFVRQLAARPPVTVLLEDFVHTDDPGWRLLARLRRLPATAKLPVVACTTQRDSLDELMPRFRGWGVSVVTKPFVLDQLRATVAAGIRTLAASPIPGPRGAAR